MSAFSFQSGTQVQKYFQLLPRSRTCHITVFNFNPNPPYPRRYHSKSNPRPRPLHTHQRWPLLRSETSKGPPMTRSGVLRRSQSWRNPVYYLSDDWLLPNLSSMSNARLILSIIFKAKTLDVADANKGRCLGNNYPYIASAKPLRHPPRR